MSFSEIIFLSVLALLVFGPRRLPEIARLVGKTMGELRRASNEFRNSLEEEIRNIEYQESVKKAQSSLPPADAEPAQEHSAETFHSPSTTIEHSVATDPYSMSAPEPAPDPQPETADDVAAEAVSGDAPLDAQPVEHLAAGTPSSSGLPEATLQSHDCQ